MCQACASGYSRSASNVCGKCPDSWVNSLRIIGIMTAVIIVACVMVRTTRNSAYKPKSLQSVYIKIFVNYLQLVMLTTTFDLQWPSLVLKIFSIQNDAGTVTDQIFSFDCFLNVDGGEEGMKQVYFNKLILMSLIPIVIAVAVLIFWVALGVFKKSFKNFQNDFVSTLVILLFLIHPNLVKTMFGAFSCKEIDPGEFWLTDNLDIRCWDGSHVFYSVSVALPSIIVWGIGIPSTCLYFLWKNHRNLESISVRLRFGFLFNGYKNRSYYWEFVILYRKILIICCAVFLANVSTSIQALTVMILLLLCLHIQVQNKPFIGDVLNQMEGRSIFVAAITIYCGLYYLTGDLDEWAKIVFFIVILAVNLFFL